MSEHLEESLRRHADELGGNGERYYGPAEGQSLESFQVDVRRIERFEADGLLDIIGTPHKESMSGDRHVDRIKLRLTREGVKRWTGKSSNP